LGIAQQQGLYVQFVSRKPKAASSGFNAEVYRAAGEEHVTAARELHETRRHVLSHYVAGLAVECLFRAYRFRLDPEFDARHDLRELYRASEFDTIIPDGVKPEVSAALGEVVSRWNNDFRFRSEASLRNYLRKAGLNHGVRGDFVKESSRRIVEAALVIVNLGVSQWNRSSKD
jgi:hypothetical protein